MSQAWLITVEALTAFYLIGGSLVIDASQNMPSKFLFKVVPMGLGLPLAAQYLIHWITKA